ncbi:hypothetical protein Pelo_17071 [Pelomyxa schiedti]|nr:hypothetical protein Pelo_17071 [Pelomyxa schiedti]
MVKVNWGGFVSNSSSTSYFVMWTEKPVNAVKGGRNPAHNCVATDVLAEELDGFPPECRNPPTLCVAHARHDDGMMFGMPSLDAIIPPRPEGEVFLCNECMTRCDTWLDSVIHWVRAKRAKAIAAASSLASSSGASRLVKSFLNGIGSSKPLARPEDCFSPTTSLPVLGKDLLGWIFKRVILIWEQHYSQAYYDCVNRTSFDIRIARLEKGLHEIELRPEHYLPIKSRTPTSDAEILEATRTLLSLSTVCKSWREAALDDPVWLDVVKESSVRAFIPGSSTQPPAEPTTGHMPWEQAISLAHVTTCRELAMRVSRQTVARGILPVRKWAPNYCEVLQYMGCKDEVIEFIKGCKTGTIIAESQCVIGGRNTSLEYWSKNAKMLGQS